MTVFTRRIAMQGLSLTLAAPLGMGAAPVCAAEPAAMQAVLDYAQAQRTTGFLVIRDRKTVVERNWALPDNAGPFKANLTYGPSADGACWRTWPRSRRASSRSWPRRRSTRGCSI